MLPLANVVIAWNTVYIAVAIDLLKSTEARIAPEGLMHLSPARHDRISAYGRYRFRVGRWTGKRRLRPIKM